MKKLYSKPIPQIAWYLQIKNTMPKSFRKIDSMTTAQIGKMYEENRFICDYCGQQYDYAKNYNMHDHILHLINPMILWTCEKCTPLFPVLGVSGDKILIEKEKEK